MGGCLGRSPWIFGPSGTPPPYFKERDDTGICFRPSPLENFYQYSKEHFVASSLENLRAICRSGLPGIDPNTQLFKRTLPTFMCVGCTKDLLPSKDYKVHLKHGKGRFLKNAQPDEGGDDLEAIPEYMSNPRDSTTNEDITGYKYNSSLVEGGSNTVDSVEFREQPVDLDGNCGETKSTDSDSRAPQSDTVSVRRYIYQQQGDSMFPQLPWSLHRVSITLLVLRPTFANLQSMMRFSIRRSSPVGPIHLHTSSVVIQIISSKGYLVYGTYGVHITHNFSKHFVNRVTSLHMQHARHAASMTSYMRSLLGYPTKMAHTISEKVKQMRGRLKATDKGVRQELLGFL